MSVSSLVAVVLLSTCAASDSVPKKIQAYMGETVVLPCNVTVHSDIPTLEWVKTGIPSEMAFVYRDGYEYFDMKSPVFQFRTNIFMSKLKDGNMSLRISELRLSDQGEYQCKIMEPGTKPKVVGTVELSVGAASEPRLSAVPGEGDRTVLQCESNCWFPAPNITFLDDQGKEIPAQKPMRDQDSQRCFNIKRNVTLQTDTKRVTCRVHQPQINQTRDTEINIPAKCTHSSSANWIIGVVAVVLCVISCVATCVLNKRCSSCVCMKGQSESKKTPDKGTTDLNAEGCSSRNQPDNTEDVTAEQRSRRSTGPTGSSAEISDPRNPPNSSPNNDLPTSHSVSQIRASDPSLSGQNPSSPVRGHHANDSSHLDNNEVASSDISSAASSGGQNPVQQNPVQPRRLSDSRKRTASFMRPRTNTLSRRSTAPEEATPLVEGDAPENEG